MLITPPPIPSTFQCITLQIDIVCIFVSVKWIGDFYINSNVFFVVAAGDNDVIPWDRDKQHISFRRTIKCLLMRLLLLSKNTRIVNVIAISSGSNFDLICTKCRLNGKAQLKSFSKRWDEKRDSNKIRLRSIDKEANGSWWILIRSAPFLITIRFYKRVVEFFVSIFLHRCRIFLVEEVKNAYLIIISFAITL